MNHSLESWGISPGPTNPLPLDPPLDARSVGCTSGGLRACEAVGGGVDSVQVLLQRLHVQGPKRWPWGEWGWLYILIYIVYMGG